MNKVVVAYFWTTKKSDLPFAFFSMARDRGRLRRSRGVHFAKMLGTGTGENFTPSDADLTRWGALVVIDESALESIDSLAVIRSWNKRALHEVQLVLDPISAHGLWSGKNPFDWSVTPSVDSQIVAITRARIKWRRQLDYRGHSRFGRTEKFYVTLLIKARRIRGRLRQQRSTTGMPRSFFRALQYAMCVENSSRADLAHVD